MNKVDIGEVFTNWIREYSVHIFVCALVFLVSIAYFGGPAVRNGFMGIESKEVKELRHDLEFYKQAWDDDFKFMEYRQKFRERHPNVVYYCLSEIYYCPMVVDVPLAPCNDPPSKEYSVWLTQNGSRFRRGFVKATKSDSLFEHGKVIHFENGGLLTIDTANFRFEVY